MKLAIILTNDWELFGNGQGDYFRIQKAPLISLLEIINLYKAKLTIFAEVIQQLNALQQALSDNRYKVISEDWEDTVRDLVKKGHDVQLHIHPQILDGDLNYENKSISNLPKNDMFQIIRYCKDYLENNIKSVSKDYHCQIFRAGGYAIQPSEIVMANLIKAGIKGDSTVTKGLVGPLFDFKNAYSYYFPWFSKKDICKKQEVNESLLEMPIYSIPKIDSPVLRVLFPRFYYLFFHRFVLSKEFKRHINKNNNDDYSIKSKYSSETKKSLFKLIVTKLIQPYGMQFDYDKYPAKLLVHYIKKKWEEIISCLKTENGQFNACYIPIVLIGHTKQMHSTFNIDQLLKTLENELGGEFVYLTMSDFYKNYISHSLLYSKLDYLLKSHKLI